MPQVNLSQVRRGISTTTGIAAHLNFNLCKIEQKNLNIVLSGMSEILGWEKVTQKVVNYGSLSSLCF